MNQNQWSKETETKLNAWLSQYPAKPTYAVFDWDETCCVGDIQDFVFRAQLEEFFLKISPEPFRALFVDEIKGLNLEAENDEISELYADLFKMGQQAAIRSNKHTLFKNKLWALYQKYLEDARVGKAYAYLWVAKFFTGIQEQELRAWITSLVSAEFKRTNPSLQPKKHVQNLFQQLRDKKCEVVIVSASTRVAVEAVASHPAFGFFIKQENIIAIELEKDSVGRFVPRQKNGTLTTYGVGKVQSIQSSRFARLGQPSMIAGDSEGDLPMLETFSGSVRLVFLKTGLKKVEDWCRVKAADPNVWVEKMEPAQK